MERSSQKNLSDCLKFRSERPFSQLSPDEYFRGFFHELFFATSDRKIAGLAGGKRVRRVRPDRLVNKNCSFIWEFTGRSLKTGHFSPVFGVFDPLRLNPASAADPRGPPLSSCTRRPFLRKNGVSPRKFAGFRNPGSAECLPGPLNEYVGVCVFWGAM